MGEGLFDFIGKILISLEEIWISLEKNLISLEKKLKIGKKYRKNCVKCQKSASLRDVFHPVGGGTSLGQSVAKINIQHTRNFLPPMRPESMFNG